MRRIVFAMVVLGVMLSGTAHVQARRPCFIVATQRLSLREEAKAAKMVIYGTLANPRLPEREGSGEGTTDLHVQTILKGSPEIKCRSVFEVLRYVPVENPRKPRAYLIFFDVFKGNPDPYRGVAVKSAAVVDYLKGAMALDPKNSSALLSYFFRHLDHADTEIADDAWLEFARFGSQYAPSWAKNLPADKIARWLEQPNLPAARVHLYALLLGDCGTDRHADLLRRLLDQARKQSEREEDKGLGGLFLGYTLLRPKEGWACFRDILGDARSPFRLRLQALDALRFLEVTRPGTVSKENLVGGIQLLLPQKDIADLAVEELRRWQRWELAEQVLSYYGKDSHSAPCIRRAILRYALSFPEGPKVKAFLAERRKTEPDLVEGVEEEIAAEKANQPDLPHP